MEKKIGKYAIKNLIYYVLGGYVIGYILLLTDSRFGLYQYITLEPAMVMKGQVWRLFTWVCTAPQNFSFFIIFMFLLYLFIGKSLEQNLGAFKYNLYMISGWFFTTFGAMVMYWITSAVNGPSGAISMNVSTYYLNLASFLAFAVIFPDVRVYFFGILPIKVKWLAIIDVAYLGLTIVSSVIALIGLPNEMVQSALYQLGFTPAFAKLSIITDIFSILISLLNFIIFFFTTKNFRRLSLKEAKRRREFRQNVQNGYYQNRNSRPDSYSNPSVNRYSEQEEEAEQEGRGDDSDNFGPWGYPESGSGNPQKKKFGYGAGSAGFAQAPKEKEPPKTNIPKYTNNGEFLLHKCSICGRTSQTNPELTFRYCSKCEGNHEYCQDHLFTHVHIK